MKPEPLQLSRLCHDLILDKKGLDPTILDLREISTISDYFVICSAESDPQLKAIANHLEKSIKDGHGLEPIAVDGRPVSQWIIVDYGSVMVHIFHADKRGHYSIEKLWGDAPRVK